MKQPTLFEFDDISTDTMELFPAVWGAAERLASPDAVERDKAVAALVEVDAHRLSPLVAYLLATRLADPNIEVRFHVVQALGAILFPDEEDKITPDEVCQHVLGYLSLMRRRQIFALLQVADRYLAAEEHIASLLNACSYAGIALGDIINDRRAPASVRQQAIHFSALVGFTNTISALERLTSRLEAKSEKQERMAFLSDEVASDESKLLSAAQAALVRMK
ncbi:MAG: hypothetical protein MAG431_00730 [Chloroflexi bacterium]|nr:hypothetical protein [Chloroflexota bacterium]